MGKLICNWSDLRKINNEVYYLAGASLALNATLMNEMRVRLAENPSGKIRICCHETVNDPVHDMIIALNQKAKIKPHRHKFKKESFHVIEGELLLVIYSPNAEPLLKINLVPFDGESPASLNKSFYYQIPQGVIHSVTPVSEYVIFREVTNGPFLPQDTVYPLCESSKDAES